MAFVIFPIEYDEQNNKIKFKSGALEDLCISLLPNTHLMQCVDNYLDCAEKAEKPITHRHKAIFHAYLAGREGYAGLKLGEAAGKNAWDWDHSLLTPYRNILKEM